MESKRRRSRSSSPSSQGSQGSQGSSSGASRRAGASAPAFTSTSSKTAAAAAAAAAAATITAPTQTVPRRGRPLKEDDPDPAAERRRARVRQAQHALRMRKEAAFGSLEQRVKTLQDTVESMSNAFMEFNDHYMNTDLPQSFPDVTNNLMNTLDRFLGLAREATRDGSEQDDPDEQPGPSVSVGSPQPRTGRHHSSSLTSDPGTTAPTEAGESEGDQLQARPALVRVRSQYQIFTTDQTPTAPDDLDDSASTAPTSSINMPLNYNLNFGLWREAFNPWRTAAISPDIVSFLAADKYSFSAYLLYWCIAHVYLLLRDEEGVESDEAKRIFRYRARFESHGVTLDSTQKALYYMRSLKPPIIALDERTESALSLQALRATREPFDNISIEKTWLDRAIVTMLPSIGEDPTEYLTAVEVERYLQEKWSMNLALPANDVSDRPSSRGPMDPSAAGTAAALEALAATMTPPPAPPPAAPHRTMDFQYDALQPSFPQSQVQVPPLQSLHLDQSPQSTYTNEDINALVQQLYQISVCFGNGPRFQRAAVDSVAYTFLQDRWAAGHA